LEPVYDCRICSHCSDVDPRILQDVQRALKLKARREARTQAKMPAAKPEMTTSNLSSIHASLNQPVPMISPSSSPRKTSLSSEVDFSPLTGASTVHPVPASLDNGMTLDWSGFADTDKSEKRWKLSTTKRREKEQVPHLSLVVDQQEKTYSGRTYKYLICSSDVLMSTQDKITRIKTGASPQTLRKAEITRNQLGRRYNLVYGLLFVGSSPLNTAKVARWYGSLEPVVRSSLEKVEPFTWLKHLDKRNTRPPDRSPRHLSALIMEKYVRAQLCHDPMNTIPEGFAVRNSTPDISISPSLVNAQLFSTSSRNSSQYSADPSSAIQHSSEGRISFEPLVETTRNSLELESLRSGESSLSSMISGPSSTPFYPANARLQAPSRIPKNLVHGKGRMSSSAEDHPSGHSERNGYKCGGAKSPNAESGPDSDIKVRVSKDPSEVIPEVESETKPSMPTTGLVDNIREPDSYHHGTTDCLPKRRRGLTSLPPSRRLSRLNEGIRQQETDEEKAYERKARYVHLLISERFRGF
jgi:hypothetical protein